MSNGNKYPSNEYELLRGLQEIIGEFSNGKYEVSIGDDAAVRRCAGNEKLVLTTDISVENVDFKLDYMSFREIGYRAMVSNLSDCAAMGALPDSALIQLTFPSEKTGIRESISEIYHGFADACRKWHFPIVGGDLSSGPVWSIGITLLGSLENGARVLKRSGVCHGDHLWVSGVPGLSAAGLEILSRWGRDGDALQFPQLIRAHVSPEPRIDLGVQLRKTTAVHAAMDLSDGLSKDCRTLAYENNLGIILKRDASLVPVEMIKLSDFLRIPWEKWYFHGGEEYELLFAASADFKPETVDGMNGAICIGMFTKKVSDVVIDADGDYIGLSRNSFDHIKFFQ
jgi:thiamine-monophosphate kinase